MPANFLYSDSTSAVRRARQVKPLFSACALCAILGQTAQAADHRDAYEINLRPFANIGDLFVFAAPDKPDHIVFGLTVAALSDPDNSPSYAFESGTTYQIAIDTDGDAVFDNTLDVVFGRPALDEASSAYAQPYTLSLNGDEMLAASTTPASITPIDPTVDMGSDVMVFAGPTDDPFFGDVAGFYLQAFPGRDSFADTNVLSIVAELPFAMISDGQDQIAVSAFVYDADGTQIDRMAMPLVNAAIIPSDLRDGYNAARPQDDVATYGEYVGPLVPDVLRFDMNTTGSFPNGRHPSDDVVGLLLEVNDNVEANDVALRTAFPYLAAPHLPN